LPILEWTTEQVLNWAKATADLDAEDTEKLRLQKLRGRGLYHWGYNDFLDCGIARGPAIELAQALEQLIIQEQPKQNAKTSQVWIDCTESEEKSNLKASNITNAREECISQVRQLFPNETERALEEARHFNNDVASCVDWFLLNQNRELRALNSKCNVYFIFDRSTSVLKYSMPTLKEYAKQAQACINTIFGLNAQLLFRSFSHTAALEAHENLEDLTSITGTKDEGSAIKSAVGILLRIIEILRRYDKSKCLVFLFTDCDDSTSASRNHVAFSKQYYNDPGFISVFFEHNRKSNKSKVQQLSNKLENTIGMLRVQVTQNDNISQIMKGSVVPILTGFAKQFGIYQ